MRPIKQNYLLKNIKNLTNDVYELEFETENDFEMVPGQFITFMIPEIGARAYSILEKNGKTLKFIIKKIEIENGGRGGSKYLCELKSGENLVGIGPSGVFTTTNKKNNKIFFGTGTGFVPLYCQIKSLLETNFSNKIKFVFGVRTKSDLFYTEELENLAKNYKNFNFEIYLSRENLDGYKFGYIKQEIDNLADFEEIYICSNPDIVTDFKQNLEKINFPMENVFEEKY